MRRLKVLLLIALSVVIVGCGSTVETAGNEPAGGIAEAVEVVDADSGSEVEIVMGSDPLIELVGE